MSTESPINTRHQEILAAIVRAYIETGEPVGSRTLSRQRGQSLSPASIRNAMADLADEGFLSQPHTSAGRVPTDRAFRYYVDQVGAAARIGFEDRTQIELHYSNHAQDLASVTRDTSRLLSILTGQAALVMAPRLDATELDHVNFVHIRERQVLAVFVATGGAVQNRLVVTDNDHTQDELDRMARYLNESLVGRTLGEAREWIESQLKLERAKYDRFMRAALTLGEAVATSRASEIFIEGSAHALEQPEFSDPEKVRQLMRALEDKTALLELLERSFHEHGLMVSIGSENDDSRLSRLTIIAAPYADGVRPIGSLAVVGPVRMDYERVIPLVEYTAKALSRALEH
jgi:heat-inducible transcriptional repressor